MDFRSQQELQVRQTLRLKLKNPPLGKEEISHGKFTGDSTRQKVPRTKSPDNSQLEPEKKISRSEIPEFDYERIGLKGDIKDYLPQDLGNPFIDHETDFEYIKSTLLQRLDQLDPDQNLKVLLETIGFTSDKAAELENYFSENDHDSLACLVVLYLEHCFDQFHHNYIEDSASINTWFTVDESGNIFTEGEVGYETDSIQHINVKNKRSWQTSIKRKLRRKFTTSDLWFHGTISDSAQDIKQDIRLEKGAPKKDFSDDYGFYLTKSLNDASKRAEQKNGICLIDSPNDTSNRAEQETRYAHYAILIFKNILNDYRGLDLSGQEMENKWKDVIHHSRVEYNRILNQELKDFDYILGAVSKNKTKNHVPWDPVPMMNSNGVPMQQVCIRKPTMAEELHKNLRGIVFFQTEI